MENNEFKNQNDHECIYLYSFSFLDYIYYENGFYLYMIGLLQMDCPAGSYNEISSFWLHTQEENIRSLFHNSVGNYFIY